MTEVAQTDPVRKSPRRWRGLILGIVVLAAVIGAGLWALTDRPVIAPAWLRAQIEERLTANTPGLRVRFGEMAVTVRNGWRPKVDLRNVRISDAEGQEVLAVSALDISLAMRPLLRGLVQPKTIELSGIFATLRRGVQGQLTLEATDAASPVTREAATLAELVGQLDALFLRPELEALAEMNVQAITLRLEDARSGQAWTIDGARLRLTREAEDLEIAADLALLSGGTGVATVEASYDSRLGSPEASFGVVLTDLPTHEFSALSPVFAWLDALRAPVSGALRGGIDADGALRAVNATLQIAAGVLQPTDQTRPIPFDGARTYFTFDPVTQILRFDEITLESAWISARGDGEAVLDGLGSGRLETMVGQFQFTDIAAAPAGLYPEPVQFQGAELDFRLTPAPFRFELGRLRLMGPADALHFDGDLAATPEGWDLALNGRMDSLTPARLLELWPPSAGQKTRAWLTENLISGDLSNIDLALRSKPTSRPETYLSFDFDDTSLRYVPGMPLIEGARGATTLLRDRFVVAVEEGVARPPEGGAINLAGSSFILPDLRISDDIPAVIRLRTDSTITAALSLLDSDRLNLISKAGLPVSLAEGRARLETTLALPLKKKLAPGELRFDVTGTLLDVRSDKLVPDSRLTAPELVLTAHNDGVQITGKGQFNDVPFSGSWSQVLGQGANGSAVTARVNLSQETSDALNLGLPPGTFSGAAPASLKLDLAKGQPPKFAISSTLEGVGVSIPALGWSKSRDISGRLALDGTLGAVPKVDNLALEAPGLTANGSVTLRPGGGLERAAFSRVQVGGWLDAPVDLIGRGPGTPVGLQLRGGRMDMRAAAFGGGGGGKGGPLSLVLDRLQINDTIALTDMQGDFSLAQGLQGKFTGKVNGSAAISGQVVPQGGRSAFRLSSNDAGGVFRSAGLLKQARGGDMQLVLQPVGTAGAFNGSLQITDTRVKDAPAIAALFNALSVVGLLEQMGGQGLHFAEVDAAFRLTPERVTLTQASATGPSIGLSMDGTYDVNSGVMNMQGVFSPIYLLNGVGSVLTRRGEGVIGFNFRLTGPSGDPKVQVNPLSALTPGIFREIFRRPPPKVTAEPGETPGAQPRTLAPARNTRKSVVVRGEDR